MPAASPGGCFLPRSPDVFGGQTSPGMRGFGFAGVRPCMFAVAPSRHREGQYVANGIRVWSLKLKGGEDPHCSSAY